ncbi:MAG: NAD(P)/FAD-dependent oxidoreductase [Clostridia bacterium]|nr:NAD(P)/FAD-dependent oxidoreductase [Clostridia bacterium]
MEAELLVVGGGAAGLMTAGFAGAAGIRTLVLERNERPARKVMITGKGRCNVTNNTASLQALIAQVPRNGRFLYGAFSRFMPADTMAFFESRGVPLKTERGNRVYPVSDRAVDIVDALTGFAAEHARIVQGRAQELLFEDGRVCGVRTADGAQIRAQAVVIATGGLSYPGTGSTGDGYRLAQQAGHTVTPLRPSLVPLEIHEGFCSSLMGLSLRNVALRVIDRQAGEKETYSDFGEMLFTHFGISGPIVLSASAHLEPPLENRYRIEIDLKPALSPAQLDARLLRDFSENTNKNYINALNGLLPKKLVPVIVRLSGIAPGTKVNQITREQRQALAALLKCLTVHVTAFRPVEEAVITAGGVDVREVDPKTMASRLTEGLYFAGEVLDVDAYTGGYNLQIAFSTGRLAGLSAAERIRQ